MKIQKVVANRRTRRTHRSRSNLNPCRMRLSVHETSKHFYAPLIDDVNSCTVAAASTCEPSLRQRSVRPNLEGAKVVAALIAERVLAVGVRDVSLDRGSRRYHGRVAAFADAARTAGLIF